MKKSRRDPIITYIDENKMRVRALRKTLKRIIHEGRHEAEPDCGLAINPAGIAGQSESGVTWGLSATLHGEIDFKNGAAVQTNFTDFEVVRMNDAPEIETHIVASDQSPGGFGETAVPCVAPAVANAIFAATGKRVRRLPITPEKLRS